VTRELHRHRAWNARSLHLAYRRAPEVMNEPTRTTSFAASSTPDGVEILDPAPPAVEHQRHDLARLPLHSRCRLALPRQQVRKLRRCLEREDAAFVVLGRLRFEAHP